MTADTTPRFSVAEASRFAQEIFGLTATAFTLPSERDQNFLLQTAAGRKSVLKIAKSDEERAVLELQNAALKHAACRAPSLALPRLIPASCGVDMVTVEGADKQQYLMRLLSWLEGDVFVNTLPHGEALLSSLGAVLAELDLSLEGFSHPAMHRELHWDVKRADLALAHLSLLPASQQQMVRRFMAAWDTVAWSALRHSVIHGDANDYNVLVREGRVVGLLDFGDMVHSAVVCDLAIALSYALLDKPEPLLAAVPIIHAYNARLALCEAEIDALYPLMAARLCMSLCYAAYNAQVKRGDAYQLVTAGPAWALLQQLAALPEDAARNAFRRACEPMSVSADSTDALLRARRRLIGPNLAVSYRQPLHIVRGTMQYLFDRAGRRYLDAYNNVPHVGHCHPEVVTAAMQQTALLNTNTRYLHENLERFAEALTATLPQPLRVCYFVNSGSEANELALRLARSHTRAVDLIVLDGAYHGNTTTLTAISPYKTDGNGRARTPPWVHVMPLPDVYRGAYKASDPRAAAKYAQAVGECVARLKAERQRLCGYIAESCPSVGGQLIFPEGYLASVYAQVREAGGVCIADDVQTAYGRLGAHFYGFEQQGVVPDILVLGKPIGNGYPIGAVVTTEEIASSFDDGLEFFSTFGGSTVSCAVGSAVLEVLAKEQLQAHAQRVGLQLQNRLRSLKDRHALIGDVRGSGLFLGVELVRNRDTLEPATEEASDVVNRMREAGVLIGTDGPFHNVLKIRPPMPFGADNADELVSCLAEILASMPAVRARRRQRKRSRP
jgi:4-aminobutyrate aminotransferase-like enzyme/Ser/Thr protein kinase RdoA (MazF antagonist)